MAIPNRPLCHTCQQKTRMYFKIVSDGTRQYRWYCASCERSWSPDGKSGYFIPHRIAESMLSGLSSEQKKSLTQKDACLMNALSALFVGLWVLKTIILRRSHSESILAMILRNTLNSHCAITTIACGMKLLRGIYLATDSEWMSS